MGLKSFLQQQGFIEDDREETDNNSKKEKSVQANIAPTFFPVHPSMAGSAAVLSNTLSSEPSFVTPLLQTNSPQELLDPTFVKFFEDELVKANLPGPDYFEFRHLLNKTQEKMAAKGVVAPEVILQTVLISFEAQDITPVKLVQAAKQYKDILKQKNDDFLKGAVTEKNNQLQKREKVLQGNDESIKKIQQQLEQLEMQKQLLQESLNKERTQMEVNKTLGKEGIEKIEKAERLISLAHSYIQSTIDTDIKKLQSV